MAHPQKPTKDDGVHQPVGEDTPKARLRKIRERLHPYLSPNADLMDELITMRKEDAKRD